MAKGFKHGAGGGAPLNFKVVGGTTEPASPKENTIWVNTDVEITDWIFSASEPGSSDVMALSVISGSPWYLSAPQSLSAGDVLNFEIPENVSNTYEAINIADPTTGDEYFVRNSDGSACNAWVKGTKVSVVLSNDTNKLNNYGGNAKTAYIRSYGSYGMTEGMVWFTTATSSYVEFNALKKNGITVYPLYTMQYVNGAWIEVTAKLWQNSEWVDLIMEFLIYENGVQYHKLEISGYSGWFESDHIAMQSKNATTYIRTSEKIGLKGMNTVTVDYNGKVSGASLTVAITDGTNDITIKNITSPDSGSISCDISSVSGIYYIEVRLWKSTYADVKITRIHVGRKLG